VFEPSPAGERSPLTGTVAEGATGPRKRSGKKDRSGIKNLWKAGHRIVAAPTE